MNTRQTSRHAAPSPPRRGAALLLCLFIVFMVSSLLLNVLDTETLQLSAARNVEDYERALYLANAGVHQAVADLIGDTTIRGTFTDGVYPADDTYQYIISDGVIAGTATVQASGASGNVVRSLEATIDLQ